MNRLQSTIESLNIKIFLILISIGILSFLTMEFILKMSPCRLCVFQRIPYVAGLFSCFLPNKRLALWMILLCFLSALGIAVFHILVEEGVISFACQFVEATNLDDLRREIYNNSAPCSIKILIFGIRVTFLSAFYDLFLIFLAVFFIVLQKRYLS